MPPDPLGHVQKQVILYKMPGKIAVTTPASRGVQGCGWRRRSRAPWLCQLACQTRWTSWA